MEQILYNIKTVYIIPPILTVIIGFSLSTISIIKRKISTENIIFALVCIWWSSLSPIFILHHAIKGNVDTILFFERLIHFFYVFITPINLLFFKKVLNKNLNRLIIVCTFISFVLAILTQTHFYIEGLYEYSWGYIARGGIALQFFGVYSLIVLIYTVLLCIKKIRSEKNIVIKRKIKFILLSLNLNGLLTITNLPAMLGIDFYPLGNFIFIPLSFMAYGVLKYKLLDIRSILHITMIWVITSSLILVPNIVIFNFLRNYFNTINPVLLFSILLIWFLLNYFYLRIVQPLINRIFNTFNYNLTNIEKQFVTSIFNLKDLNSMTKQFIDVIKQELHFTEAHLLLRRGESLTFINDKKDHIDISPDIMIFLLNTATYIDRHLVESDPQYNKVQYELTTLMNKFSAVYLVPLIHNLDLLGILMLSEKSNYKSLRKYEIDFLHAIKTSATIALSNSIMYQNLTNLKNNLQNIVLERTATIEKQKQMLELEIDLAKKIQSSLLPRQLPNINNIDIAYKYIPTSGIGGDFIDIHYRPGTDELGLFVCDVSGHGVPAALTASMVKMSLNVWGKYIQSPYYALYEIGSLMKEKMAGNFFTACVCTLNIHSGLLKFANAGHPPIFIIHKDGTITSHNARGSMISDFIDFQGEQEEIKLEKGDKVVLYTDGVTEARNIDGEMLLEDVFIDKLKKYSNFTPDNLCQVIYNDLLEFSNNKITLEDDFTILIAEYH